MGLTTQAPLVGQAYPYSVSNPLGQKIWTQYFTGSLPVTGTGQSGQNQYSRIIYGGGYYAFVNNYGYIFYSTDAKNWNIYAAVVSGTNSNIYTLAYGNGIWVLGNNVTGTPTFHTATTPNGTWTSRTSQFANSDTINDIKYIGGTINLFVACGTTSAGSTTVIVTSPDGITWTSRLVDTLGTGKIYSTISFDPNTNTIGVGVQSTAIMYYSTNGTSWSASGATGSSTQRGMQFIQGALNRWVSATGYYAQTTANLASAWTTTPYIQFRAPANSSSFNGYGYGGVQSYEMYYDLANNYYYQFCPQQGTIAGQSALLLTYNANILQTTYFITGTTTAYTFPVIKSEALPSQSAGNSVSNSTVNYAYLNGVHIYVGMAQALNDYNIEIFTTA